MPIINDSYKENHEKLKMVCNGTNVWDNVGLINANPNETQLLVEKSRANPPSTEF